MNHRFDPIERAPAYVKVCQAIEADILSGRLPVGQKLPTEGDLAAQFRVNRSTVREGVRLLQQAGLVQRGAAKRWVVSKPDATLTASGAALGLIRQGITFIEAWEALALFQPEVAALAAERIGEDQLAAIGALVKAFRSADKSDHDMTISFADGFFEQIADAAGNRALKVSLISLNHLIGRSLKLIIEKTPRGRERILEAQEKVLGAFGRRDKEAARMWMRRHIEDLKRGFEISGQDLNSRIL